MDVKKENKTTLTTTHFMALAELVLSRGNSKHTVVISSVRTCLPLQYTLQIAIYPCMPGKQTTRTAFKHHVGSKYDRIHSYI